MGRPKGSGHEAGMPEDHWMEQKRANMLASQEGRAVYVRGIPPEWSPEQLRDFFGFQGKVEGVNMLPPRTGQPAKAAFVNFETHDEAVNAAQVCDNLPVDDSTGGNFKLVCSLKKDVGKKVDFISGFSDLSKARQEGRSVYISGLPSSYEEAHMREMLEPHGLVEEVNLLPLGGKKSLSCFAIFGTQEEAAVAIEALDGQQVEGQPISVGYPRPPKRTREQMEDSEETTQEGKGGGAILEIRGFPFETQPGDVSAAIETGGRTVQSVRISQLGQASGGGSIAVVRMASLDDANAVVEELNGFEFMTGSTLEVSVWAGNTNGQAGIIHRKGPVVGRLAYDRSAYNGSTGASQDGARPTIAPHMQPWRKPGWPPF